MISQYQIKWETSATMVTVSEFKEDLFPFVCIFSRSTFNAINHLLELVQNSDLISDSQTFLRNLGDLKLFRLSRCCVPSREHFT